MARQRRVAYAAERCSCRTFLGSSQRKAPKAPQPGTLGRGPFSDAKVKRQAGREALEEPVVLGRTRQFIDSPIRLEVLANPRQSPSLTYGKARDSKTGAAARPHKTCSAGEPAANSEEEGD